MTCCIALKQNNQVYLATDRCMADTQWNKNIVTQPKCFRNRDFCIAYTTSFRMGQLLQYHWNPPVKLKSSSVEEYMYVVVLDSIKKLFEEDKFDSSGNQGGDFLIVYQNRIFYVQGDYAMFEVDTYKAVGCGMPQAEASLFTFATIECEGLEYAVEDKLQIAIASAADKSCGVSQECDILVC